MRENNLSAIIVDDETHCRDALAQQLAWCCPHVQVIGKLTNVDEALASISRHRPDIVFLDIEMPGKNGFDLLKRLDVIDFEVIFTTAYDEFALEAFRVEAVDYLLKPIEEDQLKRAVEKAAFLVHQEDTISQLQHLINQMSGMRSEKTIVLPTAESAEFVQTDDIIHCQADGSYAKIKLADGRQLMLSKSLQSIEKLIGMPHFIRTHQSHLVNARYILRFVHADGGNLVLKDGSEVPVARSRRKAWKSWVNSL